MWVEQHEIAAMATDDVKRLALMVEDKATRGGPHAVFWSGLSMGLVRALRERRRTEALLLMTIEDELDDSPQIGALVRRADDDPTQS